MRLLKCSNDKFKLTKDLIRDIPKYAILSHTWGPNIGEVTFKDLVDGTGETKIGYGKIRFCAAQARRDGLEYIWVDTCCIDKSNKDEENRSIQSMFHWYHNATRCYVYLSDVSITGYEQPGQQSEYTWESAFQVSKWHTRGWTLQELLTPPSVQFFTQEGRLLGDKRFLEQQIHKITKIPILALRGTPLSQFEVHERIAWAKRRQTTREEDRAYCLQGIFGVYVPVSYGEGGENAMRRLKKEIDEASNPERQRQPEQLEQGADVESKDSHGQTPLTYAAANGNDAAVQQLLEKGANIELEDGHGRTPLSWAAEKGREAVVKLLLNKNANIESKDTQDRTPPQQPKQGANAEPKASYFNRTPLSYAAANGHKAVVQQLLDKKANVESEDGHGRTPLLWAADNGYEAVVKLLLTIGKANVNAENNDKCTPLVYAAKNGHKAVVDELLHARAVEVDAKNVWARTPLSYAAGNGHRTVVELLLDTGKIDIDSKDTDGRTPLSYAAERGHETVIKRLLATGKVDIYSEATPGRHTPLSYAVEQRREAVVKLLLATRKADIDSKL